VNRIVAHPGACRGHIRLFLRGTRTRIGTARFAIGGGNERPIRVPLTARALRMLDRGARVSVIARARATDAGGRRLAAKASLTLVGPASR